MKNIIQLIKTFFTKNKYIVCCDNLFEKYINECHSNLNLYNKNLVIKKQNILICSICLENENDNEIHIEKMITKCGHYFHKECFFRYNSTKNKKNCPMCMKYHYERYTCKIYTKEELYKTDKYLHDTIFYIKNILNDCADNFVISGSFAVYSYLKMHGRILHWKPTDIDVYINDFSKKEKYIWEYIKQKYNLHKTTETNNYNCNEYFDLGCIREVEKLQNTDINLKIDIIQIEKKFLHAVVENFDLDCCKISIGFYEDNIRFCINNDFYIDSYKYISENSINKTKERIKKYRERGFNCYDYDV